MKTKEELLEYAIQMRERGDSYRAMLSYLQNNASDEETVSNIIAIVNKLEKEKRIDAKEKEEKGPARINIIMGFILILGGGFLVLLLWGKGYVSVLPFILIAIGFFAITNGFG